MCPRDPPFTSVESRVAGLRVFRSPDHPGFWNPNVCMGGRGDVIWKRESDAWKRGAGEAGRQGLLQGCGPTQRPWPRLLFCFGHLDDFW